ncbi:MAG TPA: GGDEF domain-containing protein, partial [Steroidobacteraceae bacterium]|nr:GGDEF domain-containing protein [Steroidobacteraceae bacterium]
MKPEAPKRGLRFGRASQWWPTALVLIVVLLAGGRLISLSVAERTDEMRRSAAEQVVQYARAIDTQLETQVAAAREAGASAELDRLLSTLKLSRIIDPQYDFELSKIDSAGGQSRVFVSSRLTPIEEGVSTVLVPRGFDEQLPSGYLQLSIRPKTGWYPARDLAAAIGLLAVVAWLLAFATHDLVHNLHRAREALALSRRQLQQSNRKLAIEIEQRERLLKSFQDSRYHDAFTGLPNRRYFMDRLDRALRDVRTRQRQQLAVVLIEIDRFKRINETLGHTAGDELMVQVARRFEHVLEALDCVLARWSSEQFAVLVYDVATVDAAIERLQQALLEPCDLSKHRLNVAASVGLTRIDSGMQRAEEA